LSTQL